MSPRGDGGPKTDAASSIGAQQSDTPPATNGYIAAPPPSQSVPPTPPQSNGSLGARSTDSLSDGGVPWYLKTFEPQGTTVVESEWTPREPAGSLSEELTDMDDDELTGLGLDVEGDNAAAAAAAAAVAAPPEKDKALADAIITTAAKNRATRVRKRTRTSARRR
jgi:NuA3 HAT complex component NTO1